MPELPEVETMVRGLRPQIQGRQILDMEFCACPCKPIEVSPAARTFRRRVRNAVVSEVWRLAKRVVIQLDSDQFIVVEPRMTGLMLVSDAPTPEHRRLCWHLAPQKGRCASFEFWDRRGLGTVRLLTSSDMTVLRQSLGTDALQIDVDEWKQKLRRTRRPIKVAMLDQTVVAGIGNLYASEILHRAAVSPRRAACRVTIAQLQRITEVTREVLREAIRYEGSTLGDGTYRNALNRDGSYQNKHRVYQKAGEKCSACQDGSIRRIVQAQRSTFYCPACQK